ncbi:MAG: ACT domain-containing protein [Oscillospiraceae bacterium]|nr:ACT domain-containing protein [Oscillospiraceae bacterium]
MAIRQLSVFLENKKGTLHEITDVLAKENINLRSMCIADTADYGIVRIIADDPERAGKILNETGHTASIREVTAFAVPDCPGGLAKVLSILEENSIDIEYMYALVTTSIDKAYAVMRTNDDKSAEKVLLKNGIELLEEENI